VLDFGTTELTFYRGEIHIIKTVGDHPGIFNFGKSRITGIKNIP
jgi:hypothetical protein